MVVVLIGMSVYAYICLSSNKAVLPAAIVMLSILEVVRLAREYKESTKLATACEVVYFLVFL